MPPFPRLLDHAAPGLQENMPLIQGPFGKPLSTSTGRPCVRSVLHYSMGLYIRMDGKTGSIFVETKISDFISILICGQKLMLDVVI